jgi:hypothetical protein
LRNRRHDLKIVLPHELRQGRNATNSVRLHHVVRITKNWRFDCVRKRSKKFWGMRKKCAPRCAWEAGGKCTRFWRCHPEQSPRSVILAYARNHHFLSGVWEGNHYILCRRI